ncbi:DUF4276 family protein [Streptomyces sp. NPDC046887]|uniref:DUF4276 family protein n=1 Tax=Streptomyces sp. NPDC046887 TaxID=3155472 RepID=UPI0033C6D4B6
MTFRILFTGEGSSDNGLVPHIEFVAAKCGVPVAVTSPDFGRLNHAKAHAVRDKLRAVQGFGGDYDLVIVHRDADRGPAEERRLEIAEAMAQEWPGQNHIAVVPVRALEAWLLLDESAIRQVAENPNGRARLVLPRGITAEQIKDPKAALRTALATANGSTGRRLEKFRQRFPHHRHKLLQRLDPGGPVTQLSSWREFIEDLQKALTTR